MPVIRVKVQAVQAVRALDDVQRRQVPFASALALTRTARAVEKSLQDEIRRVFDRPRPSTVKSTFSTPAKKNDLRATVGIKDIKPADGLPPSVYLKEHFSGGVRGFKPMERALQAGRHLPRGWRVVPAEGMPADRFGNPRKEKVREVLGALKSGLSLYSGKGKRQAVIGYFVVQPGARDPRVGHLQPGVYRRIQRKTDRAAVPLSLIHI